MKKPNRILRKYQKQTGIISMFLISVLIIVYLLPREGKFKYEFQKGKPWMHETLMAPFSFPIYKSDAELQAERDSALKFFNPYFNLDSSVSLNVRENFLSKIDNSWEEFINQSWVISLSDKLGQQNLNNQIEQHRLKHTNRILGILDSVYNTGVIESGEISEKLLKENGSLVVMQNNIGERQVISRIFTQKTAYEFVRQQLASHISISAGSLENKVIRYFDGFDYNKFILPNLIYDDANSGKVKESLIAEISEARGMVQSGERIISKGDLITGQSFVVLESLKREHEAKFGGLNLNLLLFGQLILIFISFLVLYLFLMNFRNEVLKNARKTSFILFLMLLAIILSILVLKYNVINFYVIPFAIVPIIIRTFYDERLALFTHTICLLIVGLFAPNSFEFIFISFIVGVIAIFGLSKIQHRSKLFYSALIIIFSYSLLYFGFELIKERSFSGMRWSNFAWFGGNGLLVLTCYPLIYFFEKTFGFLSDATLMELSDTNQPLLRKLAEEAPGTFQHSMQVANLAEAAIYKIGGNPLLVRTGALYHDIGKMTDPMYFIENQSTNLNPHDSLEFEESSRIIISHVTKGIEMAQKHKLPLQIIDFITTHHGTSRVQYFYKSYIKKFPNQSVDTGQFTYPGPKPFSKETAVVMMADAVEASSRSLKETDEETIDRLVESIINYQVIDEQFTEADITFRDLTTIKKVFKNKLRNIYHIRIEYPE